MAHYAFLDESNIVTEVIVGIDETELIEGLDPETWYANFRGQTCKRTSYNAATNGFRFNYAGIGYTYDPVDDAFIAPQPYSSWVLDNNKQWQPPVEHPQDGKMYYWSEESGEWHEADTL
jgi:hypothetical protein